MAWADDVDPVIEHKEPDGRADQVIPVHQGIDQQLLEDQGRDFKN